MVILFTVLDYILLHQDKHNILTKQKSWLCKEAKNTQTNKNSRHHNVAYSANIGSRKKMEPIQSGAAGKIHF